MALNINAVAVDMPADMESRFMYYAGIFSELVNEYGLLDLEDCAFSLMTTIVQSELNAEQKISIFTGLSTLCDALGWIEAKAFFDMGKAEQEARL